MEKAGTFDIDEVVKASETGEIELTTAPEGYVKLHPNHHLWSVARVGKWNRDGQVDVVYESDLIEPDPYPEGYQ